MRLLGIRTAKLVESSVPVQLSIFDIELPPVQDEKHKRLNRAMDEIRAKYGKDSVMKASLMEQEKSNLGKEDMGEDDKKL